MSRVEIIAPSDRLAKRIGPRLRVFTAALLRKAEAALEQISANFETWLQSDVSALDRAWTEAAESSPTRSQLREIRSHARGLRSSGSSLGFPIISRLAASLCRLLEGDPRPDPVLGALVTSHVEAIKAALRDNVRNPADHPVVNAVAEALEDQVAGRRPSD